MSEKNTEPVESAVGPSASWVDEKASTKDDSVLTENDSTEEETDNETQSIEKMGMSEMTPPLFVVCFVICIFATSIISYHYGYQKSAYEAQIEELKQVRTLEDTEKNDKEEEPVEEDEDDFAQKAHKQTMPQAEMLYSMRQLYELNSDIIGWLIIDDTNIDYPVMQSMYDEEYYLDRDFQKNYNSNGCLIMDTDSVVGSGTKANDYADGTLPSTNLIIHGHNMKNGAMFGNLDKYRESGYFKDHKIIKFSSLYEEREYEIVSVFLSQVYLKTQTDVFKYYKFFEAKNEEEFNDFYNNIKDLQLYDTGVSAKYGDEFITLSVCAYHVDNGRLVVVGKRIK